MEVLIGLLIIWIILSAHNHSTKAIERRERRARKNREELFNRQIHS